MKPLGNLSFAQKIKYFFVLHWEKLVFGFAALSILAFIYYGRSKPFSETTPGALDEAAKQADRYVGNPASWEKIAELRQGNRAAVVTIQAERTVRPDWYQVAKMSGTPMKTRGLRADPEIKSPLDSHADLIVGSLVIKKPRTSSGAPQDDYWTVLDARGGGVSESSEGPGGGGGEADSIFSGGGGKTAAPVQRSDKKTVEAEKVLEFPAIQAQEEQGVAVTRLGVNSEQHTTKAVSSVCVTGLFPHELQTQEFDRCFVDSLSYSAERDKPQYVKLEIQRRKMVDGVEGEWEDISDFVTRQLPREFYAAVGPEVAEAAYVDPVLTLKIPPFVFVNYQALATHEKVPRIKVDPETVAPTTTAVSPTTVRIEALHRGGDGGAGAKGAAEDLGDSSKVTAGYKLIRFFDMFDLNVEPPTKVQYRYRVWLADPNMYDRAAVVALRGQSTEELAAGGSGGNPPKGAAGAQEGSETGLGGKGTRSQPGQSSAAGGDRGIAPVDFLQLDPGVRERLRKLESETFADGEGWKRFCRASDWSAETSWVALPRETAEIIAGSVNYPNSLTSQDGVSFTEGEPEIGIAARKWDPQLQVPVAVAQKVTRGNLIRFRAKGLVFNPINRRLYELDRELDATEDVANGVNFNTDSLVVDLLGGQKMPFSSPEKAYYFPAEVLVMGPNGNLMVRDTNRDKRSYRHSLFEPDESLFDVEPKKAEPPKPKEAPTTRGGGRENN